MNGIYQNNLGNPIPTINAELQTYLTENIGLNSNDKATNESDSVSLISFIKGIFGYLKGIFDRTPTLDNNGNFPVYVKNPLRKITVEQKEVQDGEEINISSNDGITSFSIVANNPIAQIENVSLGVTQSLNAISQDYHGAVLTTELKYKIIGSRGIVTINKLT